MSFYCLLLLLFGCAYSVLYTYEDFTAYTIPSAAGLNISSHYICFAGWVILRYPSSIVIACNDSLSATLWPNEPAVRIDHPTLRTNYPPDMVDTSNLWFSSEWYAFDKCEGLILQCNASIPITNHTYEDIEIDPVSSPEGGSTGQGEARPHALASVVDSEGASSAEGVCQTNVVNYYNVCNNAIFIAMTFPMSNFDKHVWSRDQLLSFSYPHCNISEVAVELSSYIQESRNYLNIDFSSFVERIDVLFVLAFLALFVVGCVFGITVVVVLYFLIRRKKVEDRILSPWDSAFEPGSNASSTTGRGAPFGDEL